MKLTFNPITVKFENYGPQRTFFFLGLRRVGIDKLLAAPCYKRETLKKKHNGPHTSTSCRMIKKSISW